MYLKLTLFLHIPVNPDPCANSPCKNGGNCTAKEAGFICACAPGYTGSTCETDVDDCASSPCLFGGQCIDRVNSFECACPKMLGGVSSKNIKISSNNQVWQRMRVCKNT